MTAASTSATALRATLPPLTWCFFFLGGSGAAGCWGGTSVGGTTLPESGTADACCGSGSLLYWLAVFMPLLPTLG